MKTVVIIGAGRSGTKFLRSLFAASKQVCVVPYDVNYIWREGNEGLNHDQLSPSSLTPDLVRNIQAQLKRQAGVPANDNDRILVEKSVPNSLRVPFVDAVFPNALYIHLIRDGREVVESAYRNWKQGPDPGYLLRKLRTFPLRNWRYGLWYGRNLLKRSIRRSGGVSSSTWGPRYAGIDEDIASLPLLQVVARQWVRCVRHSCAALETIPSTRRMELRYEDLVASDAPITAATRFIGITDVEVVREEYKRAVQPPAESGWISKFSQSQRELVLSEIGDTLNKLGYG